MKGDCEEGDNSGVCILIAVFGWGTSLYVIIQQCRVSCAKEIDKRF